VVLDIAPAADVLRPSNPARLNTGCKSAPYQIRYPVEAEPDAPFFKIPGHELMNELAFAQNSIVKLPFKRAVEESGTATSCDAPLNETAVSLPTAPGTPSRGPPRYDPW
jgi:hypothetical protein